jgi:hypothetical protein
MQSRYAAAIAVAEPADASFLSMTGQGGLAWKECLLLLIDIQ